MDGKRAGSRASPLLSFFTFSFCCCHLIAASGLHIATPCAKWTRGVWGTLPGDAGPPSGCGALGLREVEAWLMVCIWGTCPFAKTVFSKVFCFFHCRQFCITQEILQEGKTLLLPGKQASTVPLRDSRYFAVNQYSNVGRAPQSWIYWEGRRVCSIIFLKHYCHIRSSDQMMDHSAA